MGNSVPNTVSFQCGSAFYADSSRELAVEVRKGSSEFLLHAPSYVYIYEEGASNYIVSQYVENEINSVITFSNHHFVIGKKYYAVWNKCNCSSSRELARSELLEYTTWKIKFAEQESAALREAKRKQETEELLRREQSLEAGNSSNYWKLSEAERSVFRRQFQQIDRNSDGKITPKELQEYYSRALGAKLSDLEIQDMFKEADYNHDNGIQFWEFMDITVAATSGRTSLKWEKLANLFNDELNHAKRQRR